jgi:hypothetical protein
MTTALGAAAVWALAAAQLVWIRRPPVPAKALGVCQLVLGLAVVAATATGVLITDTTNQEEAQWSRSTRKRRWATS